MQRQLTKRIGELLMDMDGAPQAASSVVVNGQNVPMSYGQGDHHVRLSYLTPAEQTLLADVDMYDSDPPHRGPAGIPNFNNGTGDGEGDGEGEGEGEGAFGGVGGEFGGLGGEAGVGAGTGDSDSGGGGGVSVDPGFGSLGVADSPSDAPGTVSVDPGFGTLGVADQEAAPGSDVDFDITDPTEDTTATAAISLGGFPGADNTISVSQIEGLITDPASFTRGRTSNAQLQAFLARNPNLRGRITTVQDLQDLKDETLSIVEAQRSRTNAANAAFNTVESDIVSTANAISLGINADLSDENGNLTAEGLAVANANLSQGGFGALSPGGGFGGANSEVAQDFLSNVTDLTAVSPISIQDISALNASTATGFAVNEPQPTQQGILAGQIFGRNNPTAANVVGGLAGLVSPAISVASALSGQPTGILGLIGQAVPSLGISQGAASLGNALSEGFGAVTGAIGAGAESIGFGPDGTSPDGGGFGPDGGGGVDGGGPPPVPRVPATPATPATPPVPGTLDQLDLTLLPGVAQNLPPAAGTAQTTSPFAQPTLPPVFTEQDARLLLQQTGQLPLAGIA